MNNYYKIKITNSDLFIKILLYLIYYNLKKI